MTVRDKTWGRFAGQAVVIGAVVFGAVRIARALDGRPGVSPRTYFTISGRLTGVSGTSPGLTFLFHKGASTCTPPTSSESYDPATSSYSAQVDYSMGTGCSPGFFDGGDITVDVSTGGMVVVRGQPVNPVPYAQFAAVAGSVGTSDCPMGYTLTSDPAFTGDMRLCQRHRTDGTVYDEVVRVGVGASAFWIDRYEASVWAVSDGSTGQHFLSVGDFDAASFPPNGQWTTPLFALSCATVTPAAHITWFQAQASCRSAGKKLPNGEEWIAAARGTSDPTMPSTGLGGLCVTMSSTGVQQTGGRTGCQSAWGAQDMIGNLEEWTSEWYAGLATSSDSTSSGIWPTGYNNDGTINIVTSVGGVTGTLANLPGAALRGGYYNSGTSAGVYELNLAQSPVSGSNDPSDGFRCMIPR